MKSIKELLKEEKRKEAVLKKNQITIDKNNKEVQYCETNFPETTKEFKNTLNKMYITFCEKQHDYGPSNISLGRD